MEECLNTVRRNITFHNKSVGTPNTDDEGYHETITKSWLRNATEFLAECSSSDLEENTNAFIKSKRGTSEYPLQFYSKEILFSVYARHNWVEPDLE